MKKLMKAFALAGSAAVAGVYGSYRKTFGVNKKKLPAYNSLPSGAQYSRRRKEMLDLIETSAKIPYEDIYTRSMDGLKLHARLYRGGESSPVQIMFHGYRSTSIRDFSGGLQCAVDMGYNVILVDQRAHGESEGRNLGFGVLERHDCISWIDYAIQLFGADCDIFLTGLSMGASTVLMASNMDLPINVRGIIADCGFTSPREIICKVMGEMGLPSSILYPLVRAGARIFGGFDPDSVSATECLKNAKVPVLFIHGEDDRFVPAEMGIKNYEACTSYKEIFTVPGAGHGISYIEDEIGYKAALKGFLERCLSEIQ